MQNGEALVDLYVDDFFKSPRIAGKLLSKVVDVCAKREDIVRIRVCADVCEPEEILAGPEESINLRLRYKAFYEKHGFVAQGDCSGITGIEMVRNIERAAGAAQ